MTITPAPRERLTLGKPEAGNGASEGRAAKTPAPGPQKQPRGGFNHAVANEIREFVFPDKRPISIIRHGVVFATPFQNEEGCTLIALKGGGKPFPIRIAYSDFKTWWLGK